MGMENEAIPAGWYDDGHGATRWWDGTRWTENVAANRSQQDESGPEPPVVEPSPASGSQPYGPGAPQQATASTTSAPARKPGLWIALTAGAVVVAGLVIGAALLIPRAINPTSVVAASATPSPSPAASAEAEPTTPALSEADKAAAVATVEAYSDAWLLADCDAYFATTTEHYRQLIELTECEAFYVNSRGWVEGIDEYARSVVEAEQVGDSVAVSISETYTSAWDPEGNPLDGPTAQDVRTEYVVVEDQGAWKVDNDLWE
jgi:hypothetical protein